MAQLAGCAHVQRTGRGAFLSRRPRVPPCSISRAQCTSYRTTTCFSGSLVAMQKWRLFVLQTSPIRAGHGREDAFVFLLISASTSLFSTAHGHGSGNKRAVCSSDLPCTLILFLERESFFPAFHSITVTSLSWEAPTVKEKKDAMSSGIISPLEWHDVARATPFNRHRRHPFLILRQCY
ncbi:hypothetical protein BDV98DRAFT_317034 [Pterulicium gracile]|uniref:Uncharacterized protein n=1 Tax=Pterulicium gracile TaxID=1884261 RepID=A0A5C3QSW6_9AGAR|nr:hypothetical protein BDV98DRAFT_317034 [Pterula gracilis]